MKNIYLLLIGLTLLMGIGLTQAYLLNQNPHQQVLAPPFKAQNHSTLSNPLTNVGVEHDSTVAPALHPIASTKAARTGKMMFQSGNLVYRMGHALFQTFLRIYAREVE